MNVRCTEVVFVWNSIDADLLEQMDIQTKIYYRELHYSTP